MTPRRGFRVREEILLRDSDWWFAGSFNLSCWGEIESLPLGAALGTCWGVGGRVEDGENCFLQGQDAALVCFAPFVRADPSSGDR